MSTTLTHIDWTTVRRCDVLDHLAKGWEVSDDQSDVKRGWVRMHRVTVPAFAGPAAGEA